VERVEIWRLKPGLGGGAAVELSEWKGGRVVACDELSNAWNKTYCQQEKANDGVFWKMSQEEREYIATIGMRDVRRRYSGGSAALGGRRPRSLKLTTFWVWRLLPCLEACLEEMAGR